MSSLISTAVAAWEYLDLAIPQPLPELPTAEVTTSVLADKEEITEADVAARVQSALAGAQEAWQAQDDEAQRRRDVSLAGVLASFAQQRSAYFRAVEVEVVKLSLAIAKKILQREAELDPTLLAGLVRIALDRFGADATATIRVAPGAAEMWRRSLCVGGLESRMQLVPDVHLSDDDCVVETESGAANFGFSAQLKDVEHSFSDLLARRAEVS